MQHLVTGDVTSMMLQFVLVDREGELTSCFGQALMGAAELSPLAAALCSALSTSIHEIS